MSIYLRQKKISKNRKSLYLEIYHNGVKTYEFLSLYILPGQKVTNAETIALAENIRAKKQLDLVGADHGFSSEHRKRANLFEFIDGYISIYKKADKNKIIAMRAKLLAFIGSNKWLCKDVTETKLIAFKEYLLHESGIGPATAYDYFKKLKAIIKKATKEQLFTRDPAADIINKTNEDDKLKKDYLLPEEMQQLVRAKCGNEDVKAAFITAYYTGLRGTDIRSLKWREVNIGRKLFQFDQNKTDIRNVVELNDTVLKVIGKPCKPDELVFPDFPGTNGCNKILNNWCKRAGIDLHITFHCGRHSFASNLLDAGVDPYTVTKLMGLTSIKHLKKYDHSSRALKRAAIQTLVEVEL